MDIDFEIVQVVAAIVIAATVLIIVGIFLYRRFKSSKQQHGSAMNTAGTREATLQSGIARLHVVGVPRNNYNYASKALFNWSDYPWLVTDAVENGWSRFAFTAYMASPSKRASLLAMCGGPGDGRREAEAEMSWEMSQGSVEFMQKIRLNPASTSSVIRTALPLPGPHLGNYSFPQESYFEIMILSPLSEFGKVKDKRGEGEKTKLIEEVKNSNGKGVSNLNLNSVIRGSSGSRGNGKVEEYNGGVVSIGLAGGGSLQMKLPGMYAGSIGFNSNGSVYLDGIKLAYESKRSEWGITRDTTIGCGFNPSQKKVFFTVDAELVHEIRCRSEEFGGPLYPTLASTSDVTVLINLGQSPFSYGPANSQRTPNPCFFGALGSSPAGALGYDDSRELFSMGRIDSQWDRSTIRGNVNNGVNHRNLDYDEESEADLFEIVLDSSGRSPNTVYNN